MSSKIRNTALFLSLILSIYFMRQAHVSPSTFFRTRILRALQQQQQVSDAFCTDSNRGITFSASQTSSADSYRHSLSQTRGDNTLTSMIQRDEPDSTFGETYGKSFIPYLVPWFVFFVIGIVGCLIFLINWCCMTCPCTRNRVCHCCRVPKTPRFRNIFVILSLMFMIFTAGAGIAGIVFTAKFPKYANGSLCDIIVAIEKIRDGSQEEMWIGVGPGINSIDTLVDRTHKAVKDLSIFDVLFADYNQRLNDTENVLNGFYQANRGKTLSRILPGQTPDTYEPVYIQRLGPPTTSGTATNEVQTEIDTNRQNLSNSQAVFNDFRSQVEIDTDQVINDALEDRPTLVDTNDKLSSVLDEMYDHRSTINTVVDVIFGVLLGLFIANLAVSVLAIFSILLVCCGAKFFNKAIHLSWCLLGILMIIGWVAAGALFGASIVAAEECDAVNNALEDPIFFNQSFAKLATLIDIAPPDYEKTRNILFRCMHGNGELAEEFNLTNNLGVFEEIFAGVNVLYAASVESLNSLPEGLASNQIGLLTQFKQGTLPDSEQTVGDIWVLNNLTSSTENPCTSVNDHWELNSQNCAATVPNDVVFAADSAIGFRIPDPTCVGYNNWAATSRDIQNRYTDARFSGLGCTPITNAQAAITYINSLASNRRQSDALIDSLGQGIAALDTQYTDFKQELQKTPLALKGANATVTGIYNDLVDPQTGLIANTNCRFIVSAVQQVQDITCTGVGTLIFQTAITYIVMSFVSLFGTLCLFCLAKRFTVKLERKKSDPNLYRVK